MGYRVVLASEGAAAPTSDDSLDAIGASLIKAQSGTEDELLEFCREADAVLVGANEQFTARVIGAMTKCRVLSRLGIGCNNIDVAAATAKGIPVSYVPDYCVAEVSDHAMALILSFARQIVPLNEAVSGGGWQLGNPWILRLRERMRRLSCQTLGIVGLGRIGKAVAQKAQAFGLRVIAYDPFVSVQDNASGRIELVDFETLLRESDYVTLHAAMDKTTYHLFNAEAFAKMKRMAYLINTGRGGLVDEAALYQALKQKVIAGAGIDVTDPEPPAVENPLIGLDNILITGHSSYYSQESAVELWQRGIESVVTALTGGTPRHLANPEVLRVVNR